MKSILMNIEMTKAILDGRKTQTRRVGITSSGRYVIDDNLLNSYKLANIDILKCGKYQKGDIVWVREPAKVIRHLDEGAGTIAEYLADEKQVEMNCDDRVADKKWFQNCQGIPNGCIKEMARIFLKITDVRVEKLHDCYTFEHLEAEGIKLEDDNDIPKFQEEMQDEWQELWDKTAPKGYKWNDNPYVFVYKFERVNKDGSEL